MKVLNKKLAVCLSLACALPAMADVSEKVSVPGSAKLGQSVTVSVCTTPKAKCKIEAQDAGMTQAMKLFDKNADKNGKASWTFDIPKSFKADKMPIILTVDQNGKQKKEVREISIKR